MLASMSRFGAASALSFLVLAVSAARRTIAKCKLQNANCQFAFCNLHFAMTAAFLPGLESAPPAKPIQTPAGTTVDKVDFERHLVGLFGRMGCNSGSCHGS